MSHFLASNFILYQLGKGFSVQHRHTVKMYAQNVSPRKQSHVVGTISSNTGTNACHASSSSPGAPNRPRLLYLGILQCHQAYIFQQVLTAESNPCPCEGEHLMIPWSQPRTSNVVVTQYVRVRSSEPKNRVSKSFALTTSLNSFGVGSRNTQTTVHGQSLTKNKAPKSQVTSQHYP